MIQPIERDEKRIMLLEKTLKNMHSALKTMDCTFRSCPGKDALEGSVLICTKCFLTQEIERVLGLDAKPAPLDKP